MESVETPSSDVLDLVPKHVLDIDSYVPGRPISEVARELGLNPQSIIKLASNENPLGMSPRARAAIFRAVDEVNRYPDSSGFSLKQMLAERFGVSPERIVLGNGSNDLLEIAASVFLRRGTSAAFFRYGFAVYRLATQARGADAIVVEEPDFVPDPGALLAAVRQDTRLVFIANPNNPTGAYIDPDRMERFLGHIPGHVVVVLDEAYSEYLPSTFRSNAIDWLKRFPNLIVTRTFSKAHGLAALRIGYALTSPNIADLMNRVRQPFNCNSMALAAAAASLSDAAFIDEARSVNNAGMRQVSDGLQRLGLLSLPSAGNFISFRAADASSVSEKLLRQGVIVRSLASYGMNEYLRVSIGLQTENERFLTSLEQVLTA